MAAGAGTLEQDTVAKIDQIRAIKPGQDKATLETYNEQMDAAWKFYGSHLPDVLPILRAQLKAEIGAEHPADLVLLDLGKFIHGNDASEGQALARQALFRLDPAAAIVKENWEELFDLVHAAAEDHDVRVLEFIDRTFLVSDRSVDVPGHALELKGALPCVFLYGVYGTDAEAHVRSKLQVAAARQRALEILAWLGSPDSVREVGAVLTASPDYATLTRVTSFMMQVGGPAGREFMLNLDAAKLDAQSREYLAKIHPAIEGVNFKAIRASLANAPGDKKLADAEVKVRLDAMIKNYGADDKTSPLAILDAGLGKASLIESLLGVRSRSLFRLSDEALSDVEVTNSLINALRYRER